MLFLYSVFQFIIFDELEDNRNEKRSKKMKKKARKKVEKKKVEDRVSTRRTRGFSIVKIATKSAISLRVQTTTSTSCRR